MNKLTIPAILAATVMVAGMFAFMPVEQASTVHTSSTTNLSTAAVVISSNTVDSSFTASNSGTERHLIMFESDVAYTISDIEVKGTMAAAFDRSSEKIRISAVEASPIEYARTANGISDLTGDFNQQDLMGEGTTNDQQIVEGDETLSTRTLSFSAIEIDDESSPITFGPNTFILVEIEMQKDNIAGNAGVMDAIVTFYVTGATEDNIKITELQNTGLSLD